MMDDYHPMMDHFHLMMDDFHPMMDHFDPMMDHFDPMMHEMWDEHMFFDHHHYHDGWELTTLDYHHAWFHPIMHMHHHLHHFTSPVASQQTVVPQMKAAVTQP
jgi:hypothetical protein